MPEPELPGQKKSRPNAGFYQLPRNSYKTFTRSINRFYPALQVTDVTSLPLLRLPCLLGYP